MEGRLRRVRYCRQELWDREEDREASLLVFVYDLPYFGGCGIFPPLRPLNQFLLGGAAGGGMSPGATWEPFAVKPQEYDDLVAAVRAAPPEALRDGARYAFLPFAFDPAFDGLADYYAWMRAVCAKHRDHWHEELRHGVFMS